MNRFTFLLALLRQHALSYLAGLAMLGATLWMTLAIPGYLREAIDILADNPDPAGVQFLNRIAWILAFAVGIIGTRTGSRLFFFVPGRRVEYDLKNRLLTHLTGLQRAFFLENPTGAIISRINNDINGVRMLMGFGLMGAASSIATLTLAPYFMYSISPRLTLYCALPIAAAFGVLQIAVRRLRREQQFQMKAMQDLSDFTVESYSGIDVLKSFRALDWAGQKASSLTRDVRDSAIRMSNVRAFFMPILTHIANGLKVMLVLVGGVMVVGEEMTMGGFMAYLLYLSMLVPPLMGMTFMMFVIQRGSTALSSLETIFNTQSGLPEPDPEVGAALGTPLAEGLRVSGLSFAYADNPGQTVLEDLSFEVRPGEIVGVFGSVGSGKTTLVNLLNGYLTPPPGTAFLDGLDFNALGQEVVRGHVVTVTQEPFLFSDTIRENITFTATEIGTEIGTEISTEIGRETGTERDEESREEALRRSEESAVESAVDSAALRPDLAQFPAGLDTQVGEKGITLSGGQKQRISLARSILKPSSLLILDDVLAAVDHETERYLIERIYGFQQARSTLIVSHRISALERAHRVLVLEGGRLTAVGSHTELIAREGLYRQSWLLQSEEESPPPATEGGDHREGRP